MNRIEHLLTITAEECAEVAQRASKMLRFGPEEIQPRETGGNGLSTNAERFMQEYYDLYAMVEVLIAEGVVRNDPEWRVRMDRKKEKVEKFLEYSRKLGTLDTPPPRVPDEVIKAWASRYNIHGAMMELRMIFEDACTAHLAPK